MELPLEFLASFLLGYAVQQAPKVAEQAGGWPTLVLLLNLVRMVHGSARIRTDSQNRNDYQNQVERYLSSFFSTYVDLYAAIIALVLPFYSIYCLSEGCDTDRVPYISPLVSWLFPGEMSLAFWLALPYGAYVFWDYVLFVATFRRQPVLRSWSAWWSVHHYRKYALVWFMSDWLVLIVSFFAIPFFTISRTFIKVIYTILGLVIFLTDYSFNRGFYFSRFNKKKE